MLKIKIYGASLIIHRIGFRADSLEKFKTTLKSSDDAIELALLDPFFYHKLGIKDIQSIQDLIYSSYGGLMNTNKSQVEIWRGRKRLATLKLEAIINPVTLFPLFSIETKRLDVNSFEKGLFFEEQEIGLLGTYEFGSQNFNIDYLIFEILTMNYLNNELALLNSICYNNEQLVSTKTDTLVTSQRCFRI